MKEYFKKIRTWLNNYSPLRTLLIFCLLLACLFEISFIVQNLRAASKNSNKFLINQTLPNRFITTAEEIDQWMTFSYINFIFKLPSDYLKTILSITDPRYPNIPIERYARKHHISIPQLLEQIKNSIVDYKQK